MNDNILTTTDYSPCDFTPTQRSIFKDEGWEGVGSGGSWRRKAMAAMFVLHTADVTRGDKPTYRVYTLDSYEDLEMGSAIASFSTRSFTEALSMVDLLSKFWGVS